MGIRCLQFHISGILVVAAAAHYHDDKDYPNTAIVIVIPEK